MNPYLCKCLLQEFLKLVKIHLESISFASRNIISEVTKTISQKEISYPLSLQMANQIFTVFGATGGQGNSVALTLQANGYKVRALTRNPESDASKALATKGCDVMKVDMSDTGSLEKAITGSYGVYAVTNFWGVLLSSENKSTSETRDFEISCGKAIADICKKEDVKILVYSGLEHINNILGKPCHIFDGKATVAEYLDEINVPHITIRMSYYYTNFITCPYYKNEDGSYTMTWPMYGPFDTMSVEDLGPVVASIAKESDKYMGKTLGLCGDRMTMEEHAAIISEVTGKKLIYNQVSEEEFVPGFPYPAGDCVATMFEFFEKGNPVRDMELTRTLNPNVPTFRQWAEKNKDKLLA